MKRIYIASLACLLLFLATSCSNSRLQPDSLVVKRLDPLRQTNAGFEKRIQDKAKVKELYEKILSIPPFPKGTIHCPDDNGIHYDLTFTVASKSVSKATVNATGCQQVTLNNRTFWAMEPQGKGFRTLLEEAIGLNDDQFRVSR